ncbi:chemotaxis protein CheW [Halodesulfurarchaeum sp.]|uniref:chemotaxis protein CheW n=1 Tax=Halodesulfurarchaeum sp. TaxID=1980530 RepID=UPI001BBCD237|nr:purine-binding chemotaxis protein CheW [Halodesulfurarchaeum sp.]
MTDQVLVFTLGDTQYCVGIDRINEIVEKGDLTALPNTADHVLGVMDLRGETTTIIDPKLVLDTGAETDAERVIIFGTDGERPVGWLVDQVHEVADVSDDETESVAEDETVRGVIRSEDRFIIWIDPSAVNSVTQTLGAAT